MSNTASQPLLSLDLVPFSAYGSWMAISRLTGKRAPNGLEGVYLRSIHGGVDRSVPVARLQPLRNGKPCEPELRFEPDKLSWVDGDASIEIVFSCCEQTLRLRGNGLGLRLEGVIGTLGWPAQDGMFAINSFAGLRHYQVQRIAGHFQSAGGWNALQSKVEPRHGMVSVELTPNDNGVWEAAVDEFWGTWTHRPRPAFELVHQKTQMSLQEFQAALPPGPPEYDKARALPAYIKSSSVVAPCGLQARPTMMMSKNWMTDIWSWDRASTRWRSRTIRRIWRWDQLLVMADHQDSFGAYPDSINDIRKHFNFVKPPIHGWATLEVWRRNPDAATRERLETMFLSLQRWTHWWLDHRRMPGHTLPHYVHGNDSGWDNSTLFDDGVPLAAPDLSAFLILQMDALERLARHLGRDTEAESWSYQNHRVNLALHRELSHGERFVARLDMSGAEVQSHSLLAFVPLMLGQRLAQSLRDNLVDQLKEFETEFGLASESPKSPNYEADGYWRGPIWGASTVLLIDGLERSGHLDTARRIAAKFCEMCTRHGLPENFDALTGAPLRDPAYTWTASCFLIASEFLARTA